LTRLVNFSQTGEFREAKASESGGALCVYQEKRITEQAAGGDRRGFPIGELCGFHASF
jgi:hypothetical protein